MAHAVIQISVLRELKPSFVSLNIFVLLWEHMNCVGKKKAKTCIPLKFLRVDHSLREDLL